MHVWLIQLVKHFKHKASVHLFWEGGAGNDETPMGRKGQAEIPQELCSEEAQRPPMESELFPAPPGSVIKNGSG
ncbi:hypothetical protein EQV77_15465 [Halobacillus fulvus]|nr:hypothetical protein EQV77_15465 [Halobacillus fulvus]